MPPEVSKKISKPAQGVDTKKTSSQEGETKSTDSRSAQGVCELLAVPKTPKPRKPKEKKPVDNLPKKNAQRAKGSISLNKTIEFSENEAKVEKRRPARSSEKLPKSPKPGEEEATPPKNAAPKRKKKPSTTEAGEKREKGEKAEKAEKVEKPEKPEKSESKDKGDKGNKRTAKPVSSVTKEPSTESVSEKPVEVVNQAATEVKNDEIQTVNTSFNSCSFFERIQQGMKAYFGSRSSFNPIEQDRNKKEGGIRTRGKGVKEAVKKSKPRNKINNNNEESDLLQDRLMVLGGQSSNFLSTKPKILRHFRKLKRKKLYHPKKYYVRIQIPRKGYFYRSTVGLQIPERPSAEPQRPRSKAEIGSKSQTSGLVKACPKTGQLQRPKKAVKKQSRKNREPEEIPADQPSTKDLQELLYEFDRRSSDSDFHQRVCQLVELNWPEQWRHLSFEDTLVEFEGDPLEGEGLLNGYQSKVPILEDAKKSGGENGHVEGEQKHSDSSWDALLNCFNSALTRNQFVYNVEVAGVSPGWGSSLQRIEEEPWKRERPKSYVDSNFLMGEVDLHMELQNYLKAIESSHNTTKSRTKNTLQCNFYDNYIPLKIYSSSQELQGRPEEFFDVTENKSGTSFNSATSDCPQLEEVTNEVFLNVSEAPPEAPLTRDDGKDKPEVEPGKPQQQDTKLKYTVKRTAGITSFQVFRLDDKKTWGSPFMSPVPSGLGGDLNDDYEKIKPYNPGPSVQNTESRTKYKRDVVSRNSVSSVPMANVASDLIPLEHATIQKTISGPTVPTTESTFKWSPTLPELIDIYNSVLKQNTKIRRSSKNLVTRCLSSHLFSFLNEKIKEKHYKSELMNLTKEIGSRKAQKFEKNPTNKRDLVSIEEYVSIFQEILNSSLSISQIARLNNIISGLQDYSEKNYQFVSEVSKQLSTSSFPPKPETKPETKPEVKPSEPKVEKSPRTAVRNLPPRRKISPPKRVEKHQVRDKFQVTPRVRRIPPRRQKPKPKQQTKPVVVPKPKLKPKPKVKPKTEKLVKTKLPSPTELESILKLGFTPDGDLPTQQELENDKQKILVTVNLRGNRVLVNGFSYFTNEKALPGDKSQGKGETELIIENVTKKKFSGDVWWRNTKSSKLRMRSNSSSEDERSEKQRPKPVMKLKKAVKRGKQQKRPKADAAKEKKIRKPNERQSMMFEYDQNQLRVQHPIVAIAEMSESKVSQQVEIEQKKAEPPPETKILLQDIPITPAAMKEAVKAALKKKVFSKDLTCGFGWSEEEIGKATNRVGSRRLNPRVKRRASPKKKSTAAKARSMVELEKTGERKATSKRGSPRHRSTYLCYSSEVKPHVKTTKATAEKKTATTRAATGKKTISKSENQKQKENKNVRRETTAKKVNLPTSKPTTPETPQPVTMKPSTETASLYRSAVSTDSSQMELLYSEVKNPNLSEKPGTRDIESADCIRNSSEVSRNKESAVTILPPAGCNDCISFLAEMIHSDSFLGDFPNHAVSSSKLKSLLKCNSDLKFYPGRLTENGTAEEKPLVTFVLTPSQKDRAHLPENQVTVVRKGEPVARTKPDVIEDSEDEIQETKTLKSIEEFIQYLSKCRKAMRRKKQKLKEAEQKKLEGKKSKPGAVAATTATTNGTGWVELPPGRKPSGKECAKGKPSSEKTRRSGTSKTTKKKIGAGSDVFLDKIVNNLSQALKNLKQENKRDVRKATEERKKKVASQQAEKKIGDVRSDTKRNIKYNPTEASPDLANISPDVVLAIKAAIAQAEGFTDTEEIIAAIGDGFPKVKESKDEDAVARKIDEMKAKLQEKEENGPKGGQRREEEAPQPRGEIELLDSLVSYETEGGDLKRKNSTYFDAVEKIRGSEEQQAVIGDTRTTPDGTIDLNLEFGVKELKRMKSHSFLTPSDEQLLSKDFLGKESEDVLFEKISHSLDNGRISRLMALFEGYLNKTKDSDCGRLVKLLTLVEGKSNNLMMSMERAAWLKVLSLLDEMCRVSEGEHLEGSKKTRMDTTKYFLDKIQLLNRRRMLDLKNFTSCFANPQQQDDVGSVFVRIKQSLKLFTDKFIWNASQVLHDDPNAEGRDLRLKVSSAMSLPQIRGAEGEKAIKVEDAAEVRRKLQRQLACIQEVLGTEANDWEFPPDIRDVRKKVEEKMRSLEKSFCGHEEVSWRAANCWSKAASLLKLARSSTGKEAQEEEEEAPGRCPEYVHMARSLIRAWTKG